MSEEIKNTKQRFFKYGGQTGQVDDDLTLEDVKSQMARFFPELSEPKVETVKKDDVTTYVFSKQAGRKGLGDNWCKICGEFMMWPASHRCPPRWQFCLEDDGDAWRDVYAEDEEHAATAAARKVWDAEYGDEIRVWIRKPDDATATLYPVTVEAVPEFSVPYLYGDQKRQTRVIEPEEAEESEA